MADILISGIQFPKFSPHVIEIYPNGTAIAQCKGIYGKAVSVPPHGRLIDADELIEKQKEDAEIFMGSTNYGDKVRYDEAMNAVANIVNAPTVIPASKEEAPEMEEDKK